MKEGNEFTAKSGIDEVGAAGVVEFERGGETREVHIVSVKGLEVGCEEGGEVN